MKKQVIPNRRTDRRPASGRNGLRLSRDSKYVHTYPLPNKPMMMSQTSFMKYDPL